MFQHPSKMYACGLQERVPDTLPIGIQAGFGANYRTLHLEDYLFFLIGSDTVQRYRLIFLPDWDSLGDSRTGYA